MVRAGARNCVGLIRNKFGLLAMVHDSFSKGVVCSANAELALHHPLYTEEIQGLECYFLGPPSDDCL